MQEKTIVIRVAVSGAAAKELASRANQAIGTLTESRVSRYAALILKEAIQTRAKDDHPAEYRMLAAVRQVRNKVRLYALKARIAGSPRPQPDSGAGSRK